MGQCFEALACFTVCSKTFTSKSEFIQLDAAVNLNVFSGEPIRNTRLKFFQETLVLRVKPGPMLKQCHKQ